MTLSERNIFLKAGIIFCAAVILLIIAASFFTMPIYPELEQYPFAENTRRPDNFFQNITGLMVDNNYYAVHTVLVLAALFSFTGMLLIHAFFERTPTPEIIYIAFFIISFSFEAFRLFLPLHLLLDFPSIHLRVTARVLLFARLFGTFSLFTAGLCAAGLDIQKSQIAVFIIIIVVLMIILGIPIDAHSWDTGFNLINGYPGMVRTIEATILLSTAMSFFIAAKVRGSKDYIYAAVGVIVALFGRNILLGTDNWIGAILGIIMLAFGSWFLCSKVHKIYLWL